MYLATITHGTKRTYQIRQSFLDPETNRYGHRLIFELGEDPTQYFEQVSDAVIFFDSSLEKAVSSHTSKDAGLILEKLLWDFLPREMQDRLSRFDRGDGSIPRPLTREQKEAISRQIHMFDRRRLYYLYYKAIDQSRIFSMRETVFRPLLGQSRDEREYYFMQMEQTLEPGEYRNYIYAIFNLQSHFTASFATYLPEALPQEKVADAFLDALCRLNSSTSFWSGTVTAGLHPHLVRYLIMFFDYTPRNRKYADEYIRQFMNSHRKFAWPERRAAVSEERIQKVFDHPIAKLKKMTKREITRLYRKKAMELHPDHGGDHDRFVELNEVYSMLLASK